jgi:cation diffusion facilitator CzcD-associated flavoprotein CzcO
MTQGDEAKNYDLLIVGAGMAGSILAASRHLTMYLKGPSKAAVVAC